MNPFQLNSLYGMPNLGWNNLQSQQQMPFMNNSSSYGGGMLGSSWHGIPATGNFLPDWLAKLLGYNQPQTPQAPAPMNISPMGPSMSNINYYQPAGYFGGNPYQWGTNDMRGTGQMMPQQTLQQPIPQNMLNVR